MTLGSVMKMERERVGLSRREAAAAMHIAENTLRAYESGRRQVPDEIVSAAVKAYRSPRIQAQRCYECRVNRLMPPWLDRVDSHPMAVRDKVLEELGEALEAVRAVCLVNKRSSEDLTAEDKARRVLLVPAHGGGGVVATTQAKTEEGSGLKAGAKEDLDLCPFAEAIAERIAEMIRRDEDERHQVRRNG